MRGADVLTVVDVANTFCGDGSGGRQLPGWNTWRWPPPHGSLVNGFVGLQTQEHIGKRICQAQLLDFILVFILITTSCLHDVGL